MVNSVRIEGQPAVPASELSECGPLRRPAVFDRKLALDRDAIELKYANLVIRV
jgi:hypothetical protein